MAKFEISKYLNSGLDAAKSAKDKITDVDLDLYTVIKSAAKFPMKGMFSLTVTGLENVPETGPVILASNHRSFVDSLFIPHVLKRKVTFVAKAEYFDSPKTRWIFNATGQIPLRRGSGASSRDALDSAREVLKQGRVFAIYPEGTRTRDGFLHRGHTGVARLALDSKAQLIPVGLVGTEHVQSTTEKVPRVGKKIGIHFGKPIDIEKYEHQDSSLALRNITDELMFEIFSLSGYGYVDTYAGAISV